MVFWAFSIHFWSFWKVIVFQVFMSLISLWVQFFFSNFRCTIFSKTKESFSIWDAKISFLIHICRIVYLFPRDGHKVKFLLSMFPFSKSPIFKLPAPFFPFSFSFLVMLVEYLKCFFLVCFSKFYLTEIFLSCTFIYILDWPRCIE